MKRKRTGTSVLILAALMILMTSSAAWAEEGPSPSPGSDAKAFSTASGPGIGFAAGAISGLGFTYRQHFGNGWGLNLAGLGWGSSRQAFANIGGTFNRTFARSRFARFYGLAGTMLVYNGRVNFRPQEPIAPIPVPVNGEERPDPVPVREESGEWVHEFDLLVGAGTGIEFHLTRNIGLALELPISVWFNFQRDGFQPDEIDVVPFPNAALIYYFN
jgi:hypothetical protein